MSFQNPDKETIADILKQAKTIAVVGLSNKPDRTSYQIAEAIQKAGYKIIPVNPVIDEVLGEKAVKKLTDLAEPVDIINVFRRSEEIMPVAEAAVACGKSPVLWLQQGIWNEEAAQLCQENNMTVIMDLCIKVAHALYVKGR